jgi:hypothetical protein
MPSPGAAPSNDNLEVARDGAGPWTPHLVLVRPCLDIDFAVPVKAQHKTPDVPTDDDLLIDLPQNRAPCLSAVSCPGPPFVPFRAVLRHPCLPACGMSSIDESEKEGMSGRFGRTKKIGEQRDVAVTAKEVLGQPPVHRIALGLDREPHGLGVQLFRLGLPLGRTQLAGLPRVSDRGRTLQNRLYGTSKANRHHPFGPFTHLEAPVSPTNART